MSKELSENISANTVTGSMGVTLAANDPLVATKTGAITTEGYYDRTPNAFRALTNFSLEFFFLYFRDDKQTHHNYLFATDLYSTTGVQLIVRSSTNQMVMNVQNNTVDLFTLENDRWYHVIVTKSGNNYLCYVDGVLKATHNNMAAITHGSGHYILGNWSSQNTDLYSFDGQISIFRIYNRTLTQAEVTTLYNNGNPIWASSLKGITVASYDASGITETGWADGTGNGYTLFNQFNPQVAYKINDIDGYVRIPFPWGGTSGDNLYLYMKPPGYTQTCYVGSDENTLTSIRKKTLTFKTNVLGLSSSAQAVAELNVTQEEANYTYDFTVVPSVAMIGARGGTSTLTATLKTYRNTVLVSTETVTPTYTGSATGFTLSGSTVTAVNRSTTEGGQRSITITAKFTTKEGFAVQDTATVSQEANVKTFSSIEVTAPEGEIPASGGSKTLTTTATYTYTSRYTSTATVSARYSGTGAGFSISGSTITAANRTTTVGSARSITITAVYTESSVDKTDTIVITQQANAATSITYGDITISSFTVNDIPAGGGTISSGTVAYSQPRTQNYTSGSTSALSALTSGATVTYSAAVTASSKGTTVSGRTDTNKDLTVTVAMNGKTASRAASVYQQANSVTWANPTITRAQPGEVPATGGTYNIATGLTYSQVGTYTSGSTSTATTGGTLSYSVVTAKTGFSLSGSNVTVTNNTSTSTRTGFVTRISLTINSKSATKDLTWNQAAGYYTYANPVVTLTAADVPASGGSVTSGNVTYSQTYGWNGTSTGGGTITTGGTISYSGGASNIPSLGTTVKSRSIVGSKLTATVTLNGKSGSASVDIYQAANSATYGNVTITGGTIADVPASGGTVSSMSGISGSQTISYTSGSTKAGTVTISYSAAVTIASKGINISNRSDTGKDLTATATGEGSKSTTKSVSIYQAGNYVVSLKPTKVDPAPYPQIPASGGTVTPGEAVYGITFTYSSGSTGTAAPASTYGTGKAVNTYSWPGASGNFTALNTSTGAVTVSSKGTTISNATTSPTITRTLTYTWTPSDSYNDAGTQTGSGTATSTVTQAANTETVSSLTVDAVPASGSGSITAMPYTGGNINFTVTANYSYTSGSTKSSDVSGSGATSYTVTQDPGGYSQTKATGIWAVNNNINSRTAKVEVMFNNDESTAKTITTTQLSNTLVVASYSDILSVYNDVKAGY